MGEVPSDNELICFDSQQVVTAKSDTHSILAVDGANEDSEVEDDSKYLYENGFYKEIKSDNVVQRKLYDEALHTIETKELTIKTLEETIASCKKQFASLRLRFDTLEKQHKKEVDSKVVTEKVKSPLLFLEPKGVDVFRIKQKTKRKNQPLVSEDFTCNNTTCKTADMDLVKCYLCSNYVCEKCCGISVDKIKQVYDKCNSLYFICKECDTTKKTDKFITSIENIVVNNSNKIEEKLEALIEKKFNERLNNTEQNFNDNDAKNLWSEAVKKNLPSGILAVPDAMKIAIREERNSNKIEQTDSDRRKSNIIIHGADEVGATSEEIKLEDAKYVTNIFHTLGLKCTPNSVSRLGKENEKKQRPIKIKMRSVEDKENVMKNLKRLKGKEEEFGKISVREDYTTTQRDEIKYHIQRAEAKSETDPDNVWKIRGDPKNGFCLVPFTRKRIN